MIQQLIDYDNYDKFLTKFLQHKAERKPKYRSLDD